jgi:S1-C subfamily serine protease
MPTTNRHRCTTHDILPATIGGAVVIMGFPVTVRELRFAVLALLLAWVQHKSLRATIFVSLLAVFYLQPIAGYAAEKITIFDGEWVGTLEGNDLSCGFDKHPIRAIIKGNRITIATRDYDSNVELIGKIDTKGFVEFSGPHGEWQIDGPDRGGGDRVADVEGQIRGKKFEGSITADRGGRGYDSGNTSHCYTSFSLTRKTGDSPSPAELARNKREKAERVARLEQERQRRAEIALKEREEAKRQAKLERERQRRAEIARNKSKPNSSTPPQFGTGSGFFVSKSGHVVTNAHVVNGCIRITVGDSANTQSRAALVSTDRRNDLALLRLGSLEMASAETKSLIKKLGIKVVPLVAHGLLRSEDVELGESVLVAGFPYGELYSNTIKVTGGMVSAVRGIADNSGQFQMDAAAQSGNSGGPIYDENGNIVGVVVAQLNKFNVAKATGSLPENVNFGIKASTVRQFLTSSGLPSKWSTRSKKMSTKELAKIAQKQTLMVMCHR